MRIVHVAPIDRQRWVVSLDEDATPPLSEHESRGEAETAARAYAQTFGYPEVLVHGADGDITRIAIDPDPPPPYPGGAKGDVAT